MTKIFLLYGHYNDKSFNASIRDTFIEAANENGNEVDCVVLYREKFHREFIEAQRSNDLPHSSSGSSLTAICDYEGLFNAVVYKVEDTLTDEELDDLWEFGKDYSTSMFQKLVY